MDAIDLLKKDHRAVEALFQRFNDGGGVTGMVKRLTGNAAQPSKRQAVAERICADLEVHAAIEESVFYPAVRALDDQRLRELVGESLGEHSTIKKQVAAARSALDDDEQLRTAIDSLQECVDHHVRDEENEMFPLLEDRMPVGERSRLGRELAQRKRETASPRRRKTTKSRARTATRRTRKTTATARKKTSSRKRASGGRAR